MVERFQKKAGQDAPAKDGKPAPARAGADDDACRCKETSIITPRQLLGLMLSDLAFWKRAKNK